MRKNYAFLTVIALCLLGFSFVNIAYAYPPVNAVCQGTPHDPGVNGVDAVNLSIGSHHFGPNAWYNLTSDGTMTIKFYDSRPQGTTLGRDFDEYYCRNTIWREGNTDIRPYVRKIVIAENANGVKFDFGGYDIPYMFAGFYNLEEIDFSGVRDDGSYVRNVKGLFYGCSSLTSVDLGWMKSYEETYEMQDMFNGCSQLETVILNNPGFKTRTSFLVDDVDLTSSGGVQMQRMFAGCDNLRYVDMSNITIYGRTEWTQVEGMFQGLSSLEEVYFHNTKFPNVTKFNSMFENCGSLRTVEFTNDEGEQVAPNAIYMTNMFRNCYSLDSLDLSHFGKLDWIVDMDGLLENCTSLQKLNIDNLDNSRIGPTNNNHDIGDDYAYSMTNGSDYSWTENPVTSQIGSYQYGRDLGLKTCTSLKTISAKNSNVWMCKNNRGLPGNEYFDASSEESMYYFTQNQMTFYPDAVDGLTVEIKTKRNYVDLLTDRDGNQENMPSFDGPEDIADRGTNINIVYGDLNLNGPGHLPAGVYTISDSGWIESDVTPDTESYYRITNIVTKEGGGWYLPNITGGNGVLGEELVQRYDRFYGEDGNWHDAIQINTISQEWPASGDYVISLEESPLVFTYNDAALDVNGKRHNVSIAINKITFKNLERFPAIPDPYTLIHNDNHYYDDGWNNEYFRPVLRVATGERLTFMNYAYKGDPLGSSDDQYRILTNGSGTEIEYTVTIDGANPNTTFVFNSNDLDIPATQGWENYQDHCYDKLTIDHVTYGRNGESVILGEGNHLGTITFAENTGLTVVDGNKVVTTGSDPSTSWSEFAVLANATGATYTWVSGIACTSYGPRDTKPLSIGRIAINPTVRKEFDGALASGQFEFLLEADGNQEQPTTVPDVPQTKSNDASGLVVFDPIILEKTEEDGAEYGYRSSFIEYPELYYPGTNPDNNHSGEGEHNQFTYWFKIKENIPDPRDPQIVYDETEHTLTVKVRPPENDAELAKGILAEFFLDGSEVPFDSVWSKVDATVNLATFVNRKDIVTVSVNKFWDDEENIDGSRPSSIFVQLYVDGDPSGDPVTLNESNQWQTVFPNLTKYKDRTTYTEYVYTVMESGIPACYDAEYETSSDNGTTTIAITNRYTPERVDVAFTKIWNDAGNQDGLRPASVQFGLFKNDELVSDSVKTISVTGNTDIYTGTFQNLLAKENGVPVTYTVKEFSPVSGTWISEGAFDQHYTASVTAGNNVFTFTNTHTPETMDVTVLKHWNDEDDRAGFRPENVTVALNADGETLEYAILDEDNSWTHTWSGLNVFREGGQGDSVVYTLTEAAVARYTTVISGTPIIDGVKTFTVTNTHEVEYTSVTVTKEWADAGNVDALRPASVTVQLYANGEAVTSYTNSADETVQGSQTLGEGNSWTFTWSGLDKYLEGQEVAYTADETAAPDGYTKAVGGSMAGGYTVTNTHEPARRSITVTKSWNDEGNRHGIRPQSVTVQLYADGAPLTSYTYNNIVTSGEQTLTGGSWAYTWENLPVNKTGEVGRPVQYTVSETSVPEGYTLGGVTGSMDGGFTVTNDIIPVTVSITANKVWDDGNNQDGVRPSSVQAQLYADGTPVGDGGIGTLDESNSWSYTWSGLDKYRAGGVGEEIVYSVKEHGEAGGSISFGNQVQQSGTYPGIPRDYTVTYSTEEAPHNGSVTITNSYVPDSVEIVVRKHWIDDDDNDGFRPESLKVQLYAGDNPEITLTAGNGWTGTFGKWPRFNQGEEIEYVVAEDDVEKYVNTIAEYNSNNDFTVTTVNITNTHTPETVDLTVYKHWDDNDNADGLRAPVTLQLFSTTDVDAVFEDDPANEGWTLRGEKTIGSLADYGSVSWQGLPKYHHGALVRYAIREKNTPADYVSSYAGGMELTEANNHTDTITNRHLSPVSVTLHVQKKISGREWFGDDDFHIALIPRPETNPMPADVHSVGGIFHSSVRIDNSDEHVSDSVRADAFAPVTFTMADLGGKPDTTFTYALRELTPEHLGEARIPGVTYTAKRFIVEVKLEEGVNNSLKATVTYYATTTHNEVEVIDSVVQVPVFTNRYDESSVLYHPRAEKSLLHLGVPALQNGDFEFRLRPVGDNAAIAPMPANTTGSGADRVLTVHNIGNSVRFFEDDSDGLLFSHIGLREHFTDDELIDGVTFSYQMSEVVPAGAVNHDDGTLSLKAGGVETVYDALVHFRQFNIRLDTVGGNFQLLQTYSDDPVHHEYFLKADGDTVFVDRHDAQGEPRHGNGMPIFRNFRIADTVVTVHKSWTDFSDALGLRPASVTVKLLADGDSINYAVLGSGNGWEHTFAGLPTARINDTLGLDTIRYSIAEVSVDNYVTSVSRHANSNRFTVTNTLDSNIVKKDTSILVRKTWVDPADTEHPDITFVLNRNGEPIAEVTLGNGETEHTFANLPYYNVRVNGEVVVTNGTLQPYLYTVEELPVNGYTSTVSGGDVTNTIRQERTTVNGRKTWVAPAGTVHPDITVVLLRDGQKIDSAVIAGTTNASQSYSFTNLPVYDVPTGGEVIDQGDGHRFEYTVIERPVEGYASAQDGFDFTNTINQEYTEIPVRKVWDDAGNQDGYRPQSVTLTLTGSTPAHSQTYSMVLTGDGDTWDSVFKDLPVYDDARNVIAYTLSEPAVPVQYASVVNGYTVTNTHTPETIDIAGAKTWNDEQNVDGSRPSSIRVLLLADGEKIDSVEVGGATGNWQYEFAGLPVNRVGAVGTPVTYSVDERPVEGYEKNVSGYNITNSYTPERVSISFNKTWDDAGNQDGFRPQTVAFGLFKDNAAAPAMTREVNAGSQYSGTFSDLLAKENGMPVTYTVKEFSPVSGTWITEGIFDHHYTASMTAGNNVFTFTNTHTPETIDIAGTKTWNDADNQDGKRPASITIRLKADGAEVANKTVTAADGWSWSFTGKPRYANGTEIAYTVAEDAVTGYTASVSGYNVTNTHTPETIDIAGSKTWDDADNQDGKRPASITIRLKADGAEVDSKTVTAADGWSWSFTGKPKYANGTEIAYTVTEDAVTGYTASVSGYNVTNTHTPDSVLVRVTKFWNDHHNNDLYRPGSITVHLVDDGDVLATRTLNGSSTSNEWEADFGKWPRRRNGTEIVYDLQEENFQFSSMYLAPTVERETTDDETLYWMRLTNTHPLDSIDLSVTKLWEDNNNTEHLRTDIQVQLYRNNGDNHSIFEPDQIDETGNYYWTPVGEPKTIAVGSGTATWQRMPLYHNGVKFNYAVKELTVPAGYTASYSDQGILNETNDYAVTITNKHVQPVTTVDIPAVRKKLLGRSWLETDTFVMALVPQLSTQPMPTTINTVEGIVYAPLAITRNNTFISDSVRQGVFAPITFTMDDMAGSTEKTFTYHIRELTAVEANLERLTGITYASERYEVDITVKEVDNALVINNVEYYPVTSEHDTEIRQDEVDIPVFVNRYNDSVTIYRMVADKQLTIIGLEDTLATGDYSFILRPVGANAAVAPMPAETVGSGADRSLTVTNEGNAIRFYDDNITDDGLVFAYQNLISSGFTDNDLRNGVEFEYELHEVIPEGCTFNHDGTATWSRSVTREDGLMVDEIYDAVVHYRSIVVTMEERSDRIILHVVGSEDSHLTDYYLDNGDTMYLEPSILAHRHSEGGVPIFHNARIARISLTVEKFWDDFDNALGTRPETVTLTLMADGVATDSVVVLGEANGWSHTFQNIPAVTSLGDHITYTVEETPVNHYEVTYDGNMTEGMYVLNTLVSYGDDEQCAIIVDRDQLNPCSEMPCPATVADADGNSYAVVKIDGYCWMAENLRTWTPEAKGYVSAVMPDEAANVSTFGYLYTWHDAAGGTDNPEQIDGHVRGICPIGWHLPTAAEINVLRTNTAEELSSTDLWLVMNGTNTSGFNARPAGYYNGTLQRFEDCLTSAWFHGDTPQSVFHISYHCCYVFPNIDAQQNAFSVRCVKDCE